MSSIGVILEVRDLCVRYGRVEAVHNVSLIVNQGEMVALVGSNGAGKTSVLHAIAGIIRPIGGSVIFDGTNVIRFRTHKITKLGCALVPEGRRIFWNMSTKENLELGGYLRHADEVKQDIAWVFELFPILNQREKLTAGKLSGGEQQMLAVARALMARPRLMMLDEPSMGLAPALVQLIFSTMQKIRSRGMAVLLVEQNARMALLAGDRGYVLERGKIVIEDKCARLLDNKVVQEAYLGV